MHAHRSNKIIAAVVGTAFVVLAGIASAADRIEQTYVKTSFRTITKSSTMIDDVSNHEVGTEVTLSEIKYSNPKFGTAQELVYLNFDYVNGSGPHRGHFIDTYGDGSKCYGSFEGIQNTVVKSDGSWESTWEGKYRYDGGSGKCKGVKGSGAYTGSASSTEAAKETGREVIEF